MSRARILLLVVALIAGGLAAFLATRGSAPPPSVAVTEIREEPKSKVLVASQPIGVGQRLNASVVEWQDWPEGAVRPEYVTISLVPDAPEELTGAVARFEFFPGEPIREAKLARADQGYLSAVIAPGMRAVSIKVTATTGAGGFIVPNDRVDVVLTRNSDQGKVSETILSNVKVLAIGVRLGELGKTGGTEEDEDPKSQNFTKDTIATVELNPGQSEGIINAAARGDLSLALRSVVDFNEKIDPNASGRNASVQMIRFGNQISLQTGGGLGSASGGSAQDASAIMSEELALSPAIAPTTSQLLSADGPGPNGQAPEIEVPQ